MNSKLYHSFDSNDYERIADHENIIRVHQILACLDNDPHEVFSPDTQIHHETGFKGDNRSEALSVLSIPEHNDLHAEGEWVEIDGKPRLTFRKESEDGFQVASD